MVTGYQVASRKYRPTLKTWTTWTYVNVLATARSRKILATNGTLVQASVRAYNRLGAGAWSPRVSQRAGVPSAVPWVAVTVGDARLRVSWSTPASNGSALTGFRIARRALVNGVWSAWSTYTVTAATRARTFTGLVNGRSYQHKVAAANARGYGPYSTAVSERPVAPPPPTPPTVATYQTVLPETYGAWYTEQNRGLGYVAFNVTANQDGQGQVTITLPNATTVLGNVRNTFATIQTTDSTGFGYISTTNTSCRSAVISSFTPMADIYRNEPQPITVTYDCPVGGQLRLNVYTSLFWEGLNDYNGQFVQPDPNDVWSFPVTATVGGVTTRLPSPTLEVVSYPVVLGAVPGQINYTRPVLLTDVNVGLNLITLKGVGYDANNIPIDNTMTIGGGVFVDGTGKVVDAVTPTITNPPALLTGRTLQAQPLQFTDCAAFGCPPATVGYVDIVNPTGITDQFGNTLPTSITARWWIELFAMDFNAWEAGSICRAYGAPYGAGVGGAQDYFTWTCVGFPTLDQANQMAAKGRDPHFCASQTTVVRPNTSSTWETYCVR